MFFMPWFRGFPKAWVCFQQPTAFNECVIWYVFIIGYERRGEESTGPFQGPLLPMTTLSLHLCGDSGSWQRTRLYPLSSSIPPSSLPTPPYLFLIIFFVLFCLVLKKGLTREALGKTGPHQCELSSPLEARNGWLTPSRSILLQWYEVSLNGEQADSVPLRSFSPFHPDFLIQPNLPTSRHQACCLECYM